MPKPRASNTGNDPDLRAFRVAEAATAEKPEDPNPEPPTEKPHAVGSAARQEEGQQAPPVETSMTPEQRSDAARKAAQARWKKDEGTDPGLRRLPSAGKKKSCVRSIYCTVLSCP